MTLLLIGPKDSLRTGFRILDPAAPQQNLRNAKASSNQCPFFGFDREEVSGPTHKSWSDTWLWATKNVEAQQKSGPLAAFHVKIEKKAPSLHV